MNKEDKEYRCVFTNKNADIFDDWFTKEQLKNMIHDIKPIKEFEEGALLGYAYTDKDYAIFNADNQIKMLLVQKNASGKLVRTKINNVNKTIYI